MTTPATPQPGIAPARFARLVAAARAVDTAATTEERSSAREEAHACFGQVLTALYAGGRLPASAAVRAALTACGTGLAQLVPLEWGRSHFVHQYWTREFVHDLAQQIASFAPRRVLEVGAGRGELTRWLRDYRLPVIATDDGSWLDGRLHWPAALPADVVPLDYAAALAAYQPDVVLCAWMPLGEDWTPVFRACASVRAYFLIGEGPGGCTGTPASFMTVPGWDGGSIPAVARHGLTRNADRAFSTSVYQFQRRC